MSKIPGALLQLIIQNTRSPHRPYLAAPSLKVTIVVKHLHRLSIRRCRVSKFNARALPREESALFDEKVQSSLTNPKAKCIAGGSGL